MEIYAKAINKNDGSPVPGATVQRLYPDGQPYSSPLIADSNGMFNGRVPDRTYKWKITSAGYNDMLVTLENAVNDRPDMPMLVQMQPNYVELPEVVVTPGTGEQSKNKWLPWLAVIGVAAYVAHREKLLKF